jgi:4-hydroxy-2-oxoheptanedioate aldolase
VALNNVEEIASVEGVDGIFFGPADIAASVGKLGMADDPVVQQMILDAINRLTALNKPSGVFSTNREFLEACSSAGGRLIGATSDVNLLVSGGKTLLASYKEK